MEEIQNTLAGFKRFFYTSALSLVLAGLNFLGLEIVGNASVVVCIIAMSPFVAMIVIGAGKIDPSRWLQLPIQGPDTLETFDDYQKAPGMIFCPWYCISWSIPQAFLEQHALGFEFV